MVPEMGFCRNKPTVRFLGVSGLVCGKMWKSLKQQAREVLRWYTSILILVAQKSLQKRNPLGIGLDARTFVYKSKDW